MRKGELTVFWLVIGAATIGALAFFIACFGLATQGVEKDKVGDLATWIGAVGTVGALFMTIRIAQAESSRRRKQEQALARITAATLQDILIRMKHEILMAADAARACRTAVIESGLGTLVAFRIDRAIEAMDRVPKISRDELRDLLPASTRAAMVLAGAQGGVFNCLGLLQAAKRENDLGALIVSLDSIIERLGVSHVLVGAAEKDVLQIMGGKGTLQKE